MSRSDLGAVLWLLAFSVALGWVIATLSVMPR